MGLNKQLNYTPLVNSPPTSPFTTVLYTNQVPFASSVNLISHLIILRKVP